VSSSVTLGKHTGLVHLPRTFRLEGGGTIDSGHVAFEDLGARRGPAVLVLGGISAGRHVGSSPNDPTPGWWESYVGEGRAIDTRSLRVLGIDWLGGAGASSGPAGSGLGAAFPVVHSIDQARAIALLLDRLGIRKLRAIVGSSFGGMVALAFAQEFPERIARIVAIGAAHESRPLASAWRSVQRRILELGLETGTERRAVAIARSLATATYRSAQEFAARFSGPPDGERLPVEGYLESRGEAYAERFDAASYRLLSLAIDLHRVEPERIPAPATLVGFDTDQLVPADQVRELASRLAGPVDLHVLASIYGHDAFLKEVDAVGEIVRTALSRKEVAP